MGCDLRILEASPVIRKRDLVDSPFRHEPTDSETGSLNIEIDIFHLEMKMSRNPFLSGSIVVPPFRKNVTQVTSVHSVRIYEKTMDKNNIQENIMRLPSSWS